MNKYGSMNMFNLSMESRWGLIQPISSYVDTCKWGQGHVKWLANMFKVVAIVHIYWKFDFMVITWQKLNKLDKVNKSWQSAHYVVMWHVHTQCTIGQMCRLCMEWWETDLNLTKSINYDSVLIWHVLSWRVCKLYWEKEATT